MSYDYAEIILAKYPDAVPSAFDGDGGNFRLQDFGGVDGRNVEIVLWTLPDPEPTLAELEAYADTDAEYHENRAVPLKADAETKVNAWANQTVMALEILKPEHFYTAMVSNIAFRLLDWNNEGRPTQLDPVEYVVTDSESQAYRDAHAGAGTPEETMTSVDLLELQETRWNQMQQGFASIVYKRRVALEKIKLAQPGPNLEADLAAILAELTS